MFFDQKATIQRLISATTQTYSGHPMYPNPVPVQVQPATAELTMMAGESFFKTFKVFSPLTSSGIQEQDRMLIGPFVYTVVGKETFTAQLALPHIEFVCERAAP